MPKIGFQNLEEPLNENVLVMEEVQEPTLNPPEFRYNGMGRSPTIV